MDGGGGRGVVMEDVDVVGDCWVVVVVGVLVVSGGWWWVCWCW